LTTQEYEEGIQNITLKIEVGQRAMT
jgi:hypothetical protein